jgi:hypothetical protein
MKRSWTSRLPLAACALGGAFAACSGGGARSVPAAPASSAHGPNVPVSIAISFAQITSRARTPTYVGVGTESVTVAIDGTTATAYACSAPACTIEVSAPVGSDTFTVNSYNQPPGGNLTASALLSSGTATATISLGAANTVPLTLGAVVAGGALTMTVSNPLPLVGTAAQLTLSIDVSTLLDANGNLIGGSTILAPLTIAPSAATPHVTVSPSVITTASTPVTVTYDGAASGAVTLVATQAVTGNVVSSTSAPLQIVPHTYFVFVPSYKTGCPNTSTDCLKIWSPILNEVVGTVAVGNGANDVAVNATLTQAYVPNQVDGTISAVDISNKEAPQPLTTLTGFTGASGIGYDATHGRNLLYTAGVTPLAPPSRLLAVAPSGGAIQTLEATHTYLGDAVFDPSGNCLYSSVYGQNQIGYADTTGFDAFDLVSGVDRGFTAHYGTSALVVAPNGSSVFALETAGATLAAVTAYPVTNPGCSVGTASGTATPAVDNGKALGISRDGSTLYVGGAGGNPALATLSTSPFAVTANYNIGSGLPIFGIAVSQDGRFVFATDNYGGTSTAQFHVIDLQASGGPAEIYGSPFFTYANTVRAYP